MSTCVETEPARIGVLLLGPHRLVRVGIRTMLESAPAIDVVGEASTTQDVIGVLRRCVPSVVVIDPRFPGLDPIESVLEISRHGFESPIIVLTENEDEDTTRAMLEIGVRGFLRQGCDEGELVHAVQAVARGGAVFTPDATFWLLNWYLDCGCGKANQPPVAVAALTPRELDVLRLLATGMDNTQIAERLVLEVSTVKSHVYHLMKKLDLGDRAKAVAFAYEFGLVRPKSKSLALLPTTE